MSRLPFRLPSPSSADAEPGIDSWSSLGAPLVVSVGRKKGRKLSGSNSLHNDGGEGFGLAEQEDVGGKKDDQPLPPLPPTGTPLRSKKSWAVLRERKGSTASTSSSLNNLVAAATAAAGPSSADNSPVKQDVLNVGGIHRSQYVVPISNGNAGGSSGGSAMNGNGVKKSLLRVGSLMRKPSTYTAPSSSPSSAQFKSYQRQGRSSVDHLSNHTRTTSTVSRISEDELPVGGSIGLPFNVNHDLHVAGDDLAGLPKEWIEKLKAQGLTEEELLLFARKKTASSAAQATSTNIPIVPLQNRLSTVISERSDPPSPSSPRSNHTNANRFSFLQQPSSPESTKPLNIRKTPKMKLEEVYRKIELPLEAEDDGWGSSLLAAFENKGSKTDDDSIGEAKDIIVELPEVPVDFSSSESTIPSIPPLPTPPMLASSLIPPTPTPAVEAPVPVIIDLNDDEPTEKSDPELIVSPRAQRLERLQKSGAGRDTVLPMSSSTAINTILSGISTSPSMTPKPTPIIRPALPPRSDSLPHSLKSAKSIPLSPMISPSPSGSLTPEPSVLPPLPLTPLGVVSPTSEVSSYSVTSTSTPQRAAFEDEAVQGEDESVKGDASPTVNNNLPLSQSFGSLSQYAVVDVSSRLNPAAEDDDDGEDLVPPTIMRNSFGAPSFKSRSSNSNSVFSISAYIDETNSPIDRTTNSHLRKSTNPEAIAEVVDSENGEEPVKEEEAEDAEEAIEYPSDLPLSLHSPTAASRLSTRSFGDAPQRLSTQTTLSRSDSLTPSLISLRGATIQEATMMTVNKSSRPIPTPLIINQPLSSPFSSQPHQQQEYIYDSPTKVENHSRTSSVLSTPESEPISESVDSEDVMSTESGACDAFEQLNVATHNLMVRQNSAGTLDKIASGEVCSPVGDSTFDEPTTPAHISYLQDFGVDEFGPTPQPQAHTHPYPLRNNNHNKI